MGRRSVISRIAAAVLGGYAVTSLAVACLARTLPLPPAEASIAATLLSFGLYATVILVVFAARSAGKAWLYLLLASTLLGGGLWLSIATGGRL